MRTADKRRLWFVQERRRLRIFVESRESVTTQGTLGDCDVGSPGAPPRGDSAGGVENPLHSAGAYTPRALYNGPVPLLERRVVYQPPGLDHPSRRFARGQDPRPDESHRAPQAPGDVGPVAGIHAERRRRVLGRAFDDVPQDDPVAAVVLVEEGIARVGALPVLEEEVLAPVAVPRIDSARSIPPPATTVPPTAVLLAVALLGIAAVAAATFASRRLATRARSVEVLRGG